MDDYFSDKLTPSHVRTYRATLRRMQRITDDVRILPRSGDFQSAILDAHQILRDGMKHQIAKLANDQIIELLLD